jgi:MoaA/NifB/PqqE/SkfB family radical SAM enzyme
VSADIRLELTSTQAAGRPPLHGGDDALRGAELEAAVRAVDADCRRLTFSGALRDPDALLPGLRVAQERGIASVALEGDGWVFEGDGASRLAAGGLDTAFVVLGGIRKRVHDAAMGTRPEDDALAHALRGLRAAIDAKLSTYVVVPLLRFTLDDVMPLLDYLIRSGSKPTGFLLAPPLEPELAERLRPSLVDHGTLAKLAAKVFAECARHRIEHGFRDKRGLLPCATGGALDRHGTVFVERLGMMKKQRGETFVRVAACASCSLSQSCPGAEPAYVARFGERDLAPVPLDVSMDWRLKPIHRLDERGLKSVSAFEHDPERATGRSLLRVNGHCNMSCAFCFIDRTVPDVDTNALLRAIDELAQGQRDHIVLSGGEPTLHPDLATLVAHAKTRGFATIEIQTNGVRAADLAYARALVDAGLNKATLSLHSVEPEISDEITRLPNAFGKTIRAIHHFRQLGVETQVAHVITKRNFAELPRMVRFLREEFPRDGGKLSVCFGIAQPISDLVYTWVMPRFDEVRPYMREALDDCLAHGLGFGGMIGQGGYPPCMLDGELRYYAGNLGNVYVTNDGDDFYKPERCRECSFDSHCLGVRKYYVEVHGDAEIRPFKADVSAYALPPRPPEPSPRLVQIRRTRDGS